MNKQDQPVAVKLRGQQLIHEPLLNKGAAFSREEREAFGLDGMMPHGILSIEQQAERVYRNLANYSDPLQKYVFLGSLQDRNETLYFHLLGQHLEELMPIIYTPTVGLATRQYSHVFQRGRGIWVTPAMRGAIAPALRRWAGSRDIRLIVATDNESILGIGDQGAGGIAISIGKLALYTAGAGVDPTTVLPVSLDVGTDNQGLLADPLYLGWRARRLRGDAYVELLDEFVDAVNEVFPGALVQWEDFRKDNALHILDSYVERVPSFNDDIQGTGATALAGLLSAERVHGRRLLDERVVILGAGAAGLGIARQIRAAMMAEGLSEADATHRIAALDSRGLLVDDGRLRDAYKRELAWEPAITGERGLAAGSDLQCVVTAFEPTVLIGTSGQPGAFSEDVVRQVASAVSRPVIMPMSNPTDQSEAVPGAVLDWTDGQALMATGSPFPDVHRNGRRFRIGQGNNAFIFPGVGLGVLLAGARQVTDRMFYAAAQALAGTVSQSELDTGLLYPAVDRLRAVSGVVAAAVMQEAARAGLCEPMDADTIQARVASGTWSPVYRAYRAVD
ncbi:MAG: NAD-dependent malic enzyme [Chromatiales bacterium]|nr:MAG: NAD-dependent malic enzyme [Chromatiales bacterium]